MCAKPQKCQNSQSLLDFGQKYLYIMKDTYFKKTFSKKIEPL